MKHIYITFKSIDALELFNLKGNAKRKNIFRESILLCFLKISVSLKKLYWSLFGNNFLYKLISYRNQSVDHFANQLTVVDMVRSFTESVS